MPTYAYKCRDCGHALEVQQSFTDASLTECPSCGGSLRKQYGSVGVTFNGSGFYRTDSRASANGEKKESGSGDGAKSDAGTSEGGRSGDSGGSKSDGGSGGGANGGGAKKPDAKPSSAPKPATASAT